MDSQDFPTEMTNMEAYKAVLEGMNEVNLWLFVQWISVGIKNSTYFDLPKEMNPFLGFRALYFYHL